MSVAPVPPDTVLRVRDLPWRLQAARWVGAQSWFQKGKYRALCALHDPLRPSGIVVDLDFYGLTYRAYLDQYLDSMVLFYGSYESHALAFLAEQAAALKRSGREVTYVDVGANVGHHALFMSQHADRVLAFEPYPPLQDHIREKIELNRISNVRVLPFGLGDRTETLAYHPGAGTNPGAGTFLNATGTAESASVPLEIKRGDDVVESLSLGRVDILKVDVEGFEAPVLQGLRETIRRDRPVILLEVGERTKRAVPTETKFRDLFYDGARIFRLSGKPGLRTYRLDPFRFEAADEFDVVILPPT